MLETLRTWCRVSCGWRGQPRPGDSTSLAPHSPSKSRRVFTTRPAVEVDRVVRVSVMTLFPLPKPDSNSDSDYKPNCTMQNFSYCSESDSHSNPIFAILA